MAPRQTEQPVLPRWLTLGTAAVATVLWPVALFFLSVRGLAENETPPQSADLDHLAQLQFGLATIGLIAAWFAHFVSREGFRRQGLIAEVLVLPLYLGALAIVLSSDLGGRTVIHL
jgi:hypothetical protein